MQQIVVENFLSELQIGLTLSSMPSNEDVNSALSRLYVSDFIWKCTK